MKSRESGVRKLPASHLEVRLTNISLRALGTKCLAFKLVWVWVWVWWLINGLSKGFLNKNNELKAPTAQIPPS
jgi:hypothetical protein